MNDYNVINYILDNKIDGDLVECGVQSGRMQKLWIQKLRGLRAEPRHIYLYDTFTGLTEPSVKDIGINNEFTSHLDVLKIWNSHNLEGINTWCYCPLEKVKSDLLQTGYKSEYLHFIQGDVRKTLLIDDNIPEKIALLRLDTDWYDSTKIELEKLYQRLVKGGVLILDDYFYWKGQRDAVDEYFNDTSIIKKVNSSSHVGYMIKNV